MKDENDGKKLKKRGLRGSKECAYIAVFVALLIAAQLCLSFIPAVEVVTVLFISYAFAFGIGRGVLVATAFSLLRQLLFGFFPTVLILYLVYFNFTAILFGWLGGKVKDPLRSLWWLVAVACLCTAAFSVIDNVITPLWYGYTLKAAKAYFFASLSFSLPQILCTAITVTALFLPLNAVFRLAKKTL